MIRRLLCNEASVRIVSYSESFSFDTGSQADHSDLFCAAAQL